MRSEWTRASSLLRSNREKVAPLASFGTTVPARKSFGPSGWLLITRLYGIWFVLCFGGPGCYLRE